jgi:hypothetical protein
LKSTGLVFLGENFITFIIASIAIIVLIITLEKYGLFSMQVDESEVEKSNKKTNFLIGYDIKSARVGGVILFIAGILIYFIWG